MDEDGGDKFSKSGMWQSFPEGLLGNATLRDPGDHVDSHRRTMSRPATSASVGDPVRDGRAVLACADFRDSHLCCTKAIGAIP